MSLSTEPSLAPWEAGVGEQDGLSEGAAVTLGEHRVVAARSDGGVKQAILRGAGVSHEEDAGPRLRGPWGRSCLFQHPTSHRWVAALGCHVPPQAALGSSLLGGSELAVWGTGLCPCVPTLVLSAASLGQAECQLGPPRCLRHQAAALEPRAWREEKQLPGPAPPLCPLPHPPGPSAPPARGAPLLQVGSGHGLNTPTGQAPQALLPVPDPRNPKHSVTNRWERGQPPPVHLRPEESGPTPRTPQHPVT